MLEYRKNNAMNSHRCAHWLSAALLAGAGASCGGRVAYDEQGGPLSGTGTGGSVGHSATTMVAAGVTSAGGNATIATSSGGASTAMGGSVAAGGTSATSPVIPYAPCPGLPISDTSIDGGFCNGTALELEPAPLDIYVMIDRTQSMASELLNSDGSGTDMTRWQAVQQGMSQFLNDPSVQGSVNPIKVGIGFFSYAGTITNPMECEPATYANPATTGGVEIDWVSASADAGPQPIIDAMNAKTLGGQCATYPALKGALDHAAAWQNTQNASNGRKTVVVFITDGVPTECNPSGYGANDITPAIDAAAAAYNNGDPNGIRTYVIGVAADSYNVNNLALAGGTGQATVVDGAGVVTQFANAMLNINVVPVSCEVTLPPPPSLDLVMNPETVQVFNEPASGTETEVPYAGSSSNCGGPNGGFYFDNPNAPTIVYFCPCTCANLGAGAIQVRYRCRSVFA
jgi:hypothetical protein